MSTTKRYLTFWTRPRSMIPSKRPLFSAAGSRKYIRAVPCNTNQCLCQSFVGLCFINQPFFRFNSSWGEGMGICGAILELSGGDNGVVDDSWRDTSRTQPSGTPRTGNSVGDDEEELSSLCGDGREFCSDWGESIWITGCVDATTDGTDTGKDVDWVGVVVVEVAEGSEYLTDVDVTLAEKSGVGGNSVLTSLDDFLMLELE